MDYTQFEELFIEECDRLYNQGRLSHFRGLVVSTKLHDEIRRANSDFTRAITTTYIRGTRELTYQFYVLVSDSMPWGYDFILTPQKEDHYRMYYLGNEDRIWNLAERRRLIIYATSTHIAESNPITGGITLSDGTFMEDVTFEQMLEVAAEVATRLADQGELYRINTDFIAYLKSLSMTDDPTLCIYEVSDRRYRERKEAYDMFSSSLELSILGRLQSLTLVANAPHASWDDQPDMYSLQVAREESGIDNDVDAPSSAVGYLLMNCDRNIEPPAFSIEGVYVDGHGTIRLYSLPLYKDGYSEYSYTQDPQQFLKIASQYFFPQEVREFLMKNGCKVSLRELRELKKEVIEAWNAIPQLREAGKIIVLDSGSVGILSVKFVTTRTQLVGPFDIAYADSRSEWAKLKSTFFPPHWKGYPTETDDEVSGELDFM